MIGRPTIICDIDGTLVKHTGLGLSDLIKHPEKVEVLPGTLEKLNEFNSSGCTIILITARPESLREWTEKQLLDLGIAFNKLIMGVSTGVRYLINDRKPDGTDTAIAINLDRNSGLINTQFKYE